MKLPCIVAKYFILSTLFTVYVQTASCSNCIVWIKEKRRNLLVRLAWQMDHVYIVYLIIKAYYCIFSIDIVLNVLEIKRL